MPKFVIERDMPKVGTLSQTELRGVAQQSNRVLCEMGPQIHWVRSFITGDKAYCIYIAPDEETVRRHAANAGFPANQVNQVAAIIDPTTAELKEISMSSSTTDELYAWFEMTHGWLRNATEDLSDKQMAKQPGLEAPPIGWHLWHIARWADRLQASFLSDSSRQGLIPGEIWVEENLALEWSLTTDKLGWLETGANMDVTAAVTVSELGAETLLNYACRTLTAVEAVVDSLDESNLLTIRKSVFPQLQSPLGDVWQVIGDREKIIMSDLLFHLSHVSRHLGMIEGLRGAMFSMAGTATI
jgi:hypothetical protein